MRGSVFNSAQLKQSQALRALHKHDMRHNVALMLPNVALNCTISRATKPWHEQCMLLYPHSLVAQLQNVSCVVCVEGTGDVVCCAHQGPPLVWLQHDALLARHQLTILLIALPEQHTATQTHSSRRRLCRTAQAAMARTVLQYCCTCRVNGRCMRLSFQAHAQTHTRAADTATLDWTMHNKACMHAEGFS